MANCSTCYETSFQSCYNWINLDLGLTANHSYWIWIKDKFENNYHIQVTSDGFGSFAIPLADFPEGLLTESAGFFTLSVSTSDTTNTAESFTIGYISYTCVLFNMFSNTEI